MHTYVIRLRKLLGSGVIHTVSGGYLFCVAAERIDLYRFRELVRAAADTGAEESELELLQRALLLWRGRPFGDARSNWLDWEVVPRLMDEWFAATERRIDLEVAVGPLAGDRLSCRCSVSARTRGTRSRPRANEPQRRNSSLRGGPLAP
ncbi:AfsR/SARP family transcriptional regulator [Virgisporangium aurantiacum]|uniref:Bacterial transcriptional activator domain-containing protein n=1 Tax=Virgisporangium aurantiacum TaxID=175570 RepID=A0A8J3ZIS7_9ACTN|nr:BTAD domain-containing putative transcriptional regulator [Virgisporangium aurantiacum]GIJ62300.1 hypothetical protein Vau01_098160 [Virgisporangium aurantiacum]